MPITRDSSVSISRGCSLALETAVLSFLRWFGWRPAEGKRNCGGRRSARLVRDAQPSVVAQSLRSWLRSRSRSSRPTAERPRDPWDQESPAAWDQPGKATRTWRKEGGLTTLILQRTPSHTGSPRQMSSGECQGTKTKIDGCIPETTKPTELHW